ncbi:MAG: hypothetical protein ACP5PB_09860 [Acidimicrobiales bacterium]
MRRGDLEVACGGAIASRGLAAVDYVPVEVAGFEIVPDVVRVRLAVAGVIGKAALCASAKRLTVRRRADGSAYQSGTAWWADTTRAVIIDLRREMERRGGRRYAPVGAWRVSGVVHHLDDVGGAEHSTWQYDAAASRGASTSPPVITDEPLDLLPADVAAPVRGGQSDVWRESSRTSATEFLTALRVSDDEARLLEAHRAARGEAALTRAPWSVTTLMAPVIRSVPFDFTCAQRLAVADRRALGGDGRPPRLTGGRP